MLPELTGFQRFLLAFAAFFKVWFDGPFAERVWAVSHGQAPKDLLLPPPPPDRKPDALPEPVKQVPVAVPVIEKKPEPVPVVEKQPAPVPSPQPLSHVAALQLLAILQRDGRLIDFLQEDLSEASDADVAAVVKGTLIEGCKKVLATYLTLVPVSEKSEGDFMVVEEGFNPRAIRLTGNVVGKPPFKGALRHHGWRAAEVKLPEPVRGDPSRLLAPAEVELP